MSDAQPYQFRLWTLLLVTTGFAVAFFFTRLGGFLFVYAFAPIIVYFFSSPRIRRPLTLATIIALVMGLACYNTIVFEYIWIEGVVNALAMGLISWPLWMGPILLKRAFTPRPPEEDDPDGLQQLAKPCTRSDLIELPPVATHLDESEQTL